MFNCLYCNNPINQFSLQFYFEKYRYELVDFYKNKISFKVIQDLIMNGDPNTSIINNNQLDNSRLNPFCNTNLNQMLNPMLTHMYNPMLTPMYNPTLNPMNFNQFLNPLTPNPLTPTPQQINYQLEVQNRQTESLHNKKHRKHKKKQETESEQENKKS